MSNIAYVRKMKLEESIAKAVSFMDENGKYIVEAGSCTTVAAAMEHRERIGGKNISLVLSGRNIDGEVLVNILKKLLKHIDIHLSMLHIHNK